MKTILPIIQQLLIDQVLSNKAPVSAGMKVTGIFTAICLFFFFAGLIALSYGLFYYFKTLMPVFEAAFITGGGLLLLSLLTMLLLYGYRIHKRKKNECKRQETQKMMNIALEALRDDLAETTRDHPETTLLVTALSGFVAGKALS